MAGAVGRAERGRGRGTERASRVASGGSSGTGEPRSGSVAGAGTLARAVEVLSSFVAEFEPGRYSVEDAATLVEWFSRAERLAGAGKTLAAARVAESSRAGDEGHPSTATWLATVTGQPLGQALDELKLGAALATQPALADAYRAGRLSRPGASLVSGAATANPAREEDLVAGAATDTFGQLRRRCLAARAEGRSASDEARHDEALAAGRRCRTWTDPEGAFRLEAVLAPAAGAHLAARLAAETDRHFLRARQAGRDETHDAYAADALCALVTGRDYLGPGRASRGGDPKARVTLRVDLAALRRGSVGRGEVCEIPGVGPVSVETARSVLGEGLTDLVVTDGVDVTTICRLGRSVPAALQTALVERDRTCVVPGCNRAFGLERDHWRVPVEAGGPTSLDNLVRLCSFHHHLRHHRGFTLSGGPGHWVFSPPPTPKARTKVKAKTRTTKTTATAKRTKAAGARSTRRPAPMSHPGRRVNLPLPTGPPP